MNGMNKSEIVRAGKRIGLSEAQVEQLWCALQERKRPGQFFLAALLYMGALSIFLAMTWFYVANLKNGYSLLISTIYGLLFFGSGFYFWYGKKLRVSGGVLASLGIVMVPLIIYSLQSVGSRTFTSEYSGFYRWVSGEWVWMELGTLLIACLVLYFVRFAFITVLIYGTLTFMTMDLFHGSHYSAVAIVIGALLNALGFVLWRKERRDFGFWSYLFGMLLCSSGLNYWNLQSEWSYLVYLLVHCGFLLVSSFFHRKIFLFFGSLGIIRYVGHLTYIFSDSLLFSYVLGGVGFVIILFASIRARSGVKKIDE
jgi:hypothetical protein